MGKSNAFGRALRDNRISNGYSLRAFAKLLGVSPTYLSQVEQGNVEPPTAKRVKRIAELFGDCSDEWLSLAGRIPDDLLPIIHSTTQVLELIRCVKGLSTNQLIILCEDARRMRSKGKAQ